MNGVALSLPHSRPRRHRPRGFRLHAQTLGELFGRGTDDDVQTPGLWHAQASNPQRTQARLIDIGRCGSAVFSFRQNPRRATSREMNYAE